MCSHDRGYARWNWNVLGVVILAGVGLMSISCQQPEAARPAQEYPAPGMHAINTTKLAEVMGALQSLKLHEHESDLAHDGRIKGDLVKVAQMAALLAQDARSLPELFDEFWDNAENRVLYDRLATRLRDRSMRLAQYAQDEDTGRVRSTLRQVIATCNACHDSFRGPLLAQAAGAFSADL